ncbi:unnamed protein product [Calypogeia fissa]
MAPTKESGMDVFEQLNDLFHEPEDDEEKKKEVYCYHDSDFLRGLLEKERDLLSKVVQENIDLLEASRTQKEESFTIQETQAQDIQEKKARIEELEGLLEQRENELKQLEFDLAQRLHEECLKLKIKNKELEDTTGKRIEELVAIIAGVQQFRDCQVEVETRMATAEEYATKTRLEMERIIPDLERNFIEKCSVYEKEFEKKLEEMQIALTETVEDRVSERTKNILADNEQLLQDLRIHMGATSGLSKQRDELQVEATNLASEIGILKSSGELHVQRGIAQGKIVEQQQAKLLILERSLRQVIRQYSAERCDLENKHRQGMADLVAEKQMLRNMVAGKTKDLKRLRCLAQRVLNQRTEVEAFLIDSLEYVKSQIYARKSHKDEHDERSDRRFDEEDQSSNASSTHLPSIRSTSHSWPGAMKDKNYMRSTRTTRGFETHTKCKYRHHDLTLHLHELEEVPSQLDLLENFKADMPKLLPKIDISDLSWSDREKVLRYLFLKINSARTIGIKDDIESGKITRRKSGNYVAPYTISESGRLLA